MFGPRLFRSRWAALLWAAGIIWTAYDIAGGASTRPVAATEPTVDATGATVVPADLAALANATAE